MSVVSLQNIVVENFPEFNPENEQDLIRAEKILKAHLKSDQTFSQNDIEEFLKYYRENSGSSVISTEDENLSRIANAEYFRIDSSKNIIQKLTEDQREKISEQLHEPISIFIKTAVSKNDWLNLRVFWRQYKSVINWETKDQLLNTISDKNTIICETIQQKERYQHFDNEYCFAFDRDFYGIQSDIDSHFFNEEILDINNALANNQQTEARYKVYLGKIFVALAHFDAFTEELKELLQKNSKIGAKWFSKESTIQRRIAKNKINAEKDYGKTTEWILLSIFFTGLLTGLFFLYRSYSVFTLFLIFLEFVVFLITNKKLNEHFKVNSSSANDNSMRYKLKKAAFKIFILQIYVLAISAVIALLVGIGAIAIAAGGFPVFIVAYIIYRIYKANKK